MIDISRNLSIKLDSESFKILEELQKELKVKMEKEGYKARVTKATAIAWLAKKYKESDLKL